VLSQSNQTINSLIADDGSATQDQHAGRPSQLAIIDSQDKGSFTDYYYQLQDSSGNPITGLNIISEQVNSVGQNSNGVYVAGNNGVFLDAVGFQQNGHQYIPSSNFSYTTLQTFSVQYAGTYFTLTSEFAHNNVYLNGRFYNNVVVIRQ
jgi:hypothetical protein